MLLSSLKTKQQGTASAGWEKFLEAVINAGFVITGTWPIRTERGARMRGQESNALASSIVLVCRKNYVNQMKFQDVSSRENFASISQKH